MCGADHRGECPQSIASHLPRTDQHDQQQQPDGEVEKGAQNAVAREVTDFTVDPTLNGDDESGSERDGSRGTPILAQADGVLLATRSAWMAGSC